MTQYLVTGFPIFCRCTYVCWYFTIVVQCYNLYIRRDPNAPHNSNWSDFMIYKYYIYEHRHKKSSLMSLQRIKNKGADQLANFSTLIVCYLDSIIPMVSLFNVNHVLYSAGWFESLISPKHPRRFSCYTAVIVVEILYTWMNFNSF